MMTKSETVFVFSLGGVSYGCCELLWRGYTHWTMLLLGGICFLGLYAGEKKFSSLPMAVKCLAGGVYITSLELVAGSIVNVALGMNVWDYSAMPFNLYGQICVGFFFVWVFICIPALFLCRRIPLLFEDFLI